MIGWISIHRQIKDHWVWEDKPFSRGQAWIDLLMMVNHEDKKVLLGAELIEVKRGSRITSEVKLAERWGWSRTKVRGFLSLLEQDNMIERKTDNKKTTLTIVNYNDYQVSKTAEKQRKNNGKTSEKHQKNTNNNDNNINNDNKDIYILTEQEKNFINLLSEIENYPLDRKKDLEMYKTLGDRYPELDLIEAIESWKLYKLDQPLKSNSNARSQINTSFKNYVKWGKCLKTGGGNEKLKRGSGEDIPGHEIKKPDYSHIGFKGTGEIEEGDYF